MRIAFSLSILIVFFVLVQAFSAVSVYKDAQSQLIQAAELGNQSLQILNELTPSSGAN